VIAATVGVCLTLLLCTILVIEELARLRQAIFDLDWTIASYVDDKAEEEAK
jgi:hypothetical protein